MEEIQKVLLDQGVSAEQFMNLLQKFRTNPAMAMAEIQSLNLSPEAIQKCIELFSNNPESVSGFMESVLADPKASNTFFEEKEKLAKKVNEKE